MTLYAVALTFSEEVVKDLDRLRRILGRQMSYSIEPHLTLKYPFSSKVDMNTLIERLQLVAEQTLPFTLVLNGIRYFDGERSVAYIAVESREQVLDLHTKVVRSLRGLVVEADSDSVYELERFTPHVAINDEIPKEVLPSVKRDLSNYESYRVVKVGSFSLFATQDGITWKLMHAFQLTGR